MHSDKLQSIFRKKWHLAPKYSHSSCYYFINCTICTMAWTLPMTAHPCGLLLGSLETNGSICWALGTNGFCWASCGGPAAAHLLSGWLLSYMFLCATYTYLPPLLNLELCSATSKGVRQVTCCCGWHRIGWNCWPECSPFLCFKHDWGESFELRLWFSQLWKETAAHLRCHFKRGAEINVAPEIVISEVTWNGGL